MQKGLLLNIYLLALYGNEQHSEELIVFCPLCSGILIHVVNVSFISLRMTNDEITASGETCTSGAIELSQV